MSDVVDRIEQLLTQLQSTDFYKREEAVKELATYDEDQAIAGLALALEDSDPGIRELAAKMLGQIRREIIPQLLILTLNHEDFSTRNLAGEILLRTGSLAVPSLIESLNNDDPDFRRLVINLLGRIKDDTAVDPLCDSLSDEDISVICSAAEALGEIGSSKAIPALNAAYNGTESARQQVIEALGKIGNPSTLDTLWEYLKSDDSQIRNAVIEAIGDIGQIDSVGKLEQYLDHEDPTVAEAALKAIVNISIQHGGYIDCNLQLDRFVGFLVNGINNGDKRITEFVLNILTRKGGSEIVTPYLDVLQFLNRDALTLMERTLNSAGPSVGELIPEKFAGASSGTRLILLNVIKKFVDEGLARKLVIFVDDPDPRVRQEIAYTLGMAGNVSVIPALKKMALDDVDYVRAAAFGALGWLCSMDEVDFLFTGLKDKHVDVREAAMGGLIAVGGSKVIAKFTADIYHHDNQRQLLAIQALGLIGESEVVHSLIKAINHPVASIRKSAINSLARIGEVTQVEPLELALNDENSGVRRAAVSTLIALRGEQAVSMIRFLLEDEDILVRSHVINSIGSLGLVKFSEYLLPCLEDDTDVIRIVAIKALVKMGYHKRLQVMRTPFHKNVKDNGKPAEKTLSNLKGGVR